MNERNTNPKVTIGVPVFNGENGLEDCLLCLLNGTYENIEIVISDNASTDGTYDIIAKFEKLDDRIRAIRQESNIGAVPNFKAVADSANSPLFMWRAHDDTSSDNFVEALVASIQKHPTAALAAPNVLTRKRNKADRSRNFPTGKTQPLGWRSMYQARAGWMYGLFRTDFAQAAIARVLNHYPHVHAWDMLMLLDVLLHGGATGTNDTTFVHDLDRPKGHHPKTSRETHRLRAKDFSSAASQLANHAEITGISRLIFNTMLPLYIEKRVARLRHRI